MGPCRLLTGVHGSKYGASAHLIPLSPDSAVHELLKKLHVSSTEGEGVLPSQHFGAFNSTEKATGLR